MLNVLFHIFYNLLINTIKQRNYLVNVITKVPVVLVMCHLSSDMQMKMLIRFEASVDSLLSV